MSGTVKETVALYQKDFDVFRIAKMRGLGVSTILNHLVDWYAAGGELEIDELISPLEQSQILEAIARVGMERLGLIKSVLPEEISYEKIKLVAAKVRRGNKK